MVVKCPTFPIRAISRIRSGGADKSFCQIPLNQLWKHTELCFRAYNEDILRDLLSNLFPTKYRQSHQDKTSSYQWDWSGGSENRDSAYAQG